MKTKRLLSVLLYACMALALLPKTALAAQEVAGDFVVTTDNVSGYTYDAGSGALVFETPGTYTVSMNTGVTTTTSCKIQITGGTSAAPVTIILDNVSIQNACAFDLKNNSVVNLVLKDGTSNTMTSAGRYPGIRCQDGATLTIGGGGELTANSGNDGAYGCAGIGGSAGYSGGNITINGGTITANGGAGNNGGAGIGGGPSGSGGNITINGGTVTANGGTYGAGIGSGYNSPWISGGSHYGGNITINGGTVTANGDVGGAGIGGGSGGDGGTVVINGGSSKATGGSGAVAIGAGSGGSSGTLKNADGADVYLTTVTLNSVAQATAVSALTANLGYTYGTTGMLTDTSGVLYLYLPENTSTWGAQTSGQGYSGAVTTTTSSLTSLGTLTADSTLPTVTNVTPASIGAALGGNIAVTFSKTMNSAVGAVSLNGGTALTGGSWSADNKTYTVPYSGLSYGTSYAVTISGFQDAAGNVMTADSSHVFSTCAAPYYDDTTYYTVKSAAGTGGSISPSGSASVASGHDKTYTIAAAEGYEVADVLVDGVSVGAVSAYTFENVKKAHTIAATFKKIITNPFADVKADDWFYDSVMYVYEKGLMSGTAVDTFSPNTGMTRAMFVTVLYRMSGDTGSYTSAFSDVPSGKWYKNAVAWAAKNGIVGGVGNGLFAPNTEVTREQLAVMLYRYAKYKGYDVSVGEDTNILSYHDAFSISEYAYSALQWACGAGIIDGDNNEYLNPQNSATRAEAVAMLQRFIEKEIG